MLPLVVLVALKLDTRFALLSVMPPTAFVVNKPGTVNAPVCVIAPLELMVRLLPTLEAAKMVAMLLVNETLFAPELESVTAPVSALACVKVIALVPALKLEVPDTVMMPDCVIAPVLAMVKLPTD